jgi:hypothetical protein
LCDDNQGIDMSAADILIIVGTVCVFAIFTGALRFAVRRTCKPCAGSGEIEASSSKIVPVTNKAPGLPDGARRAMAR